MSMADRASRGAMAALGAAVLFGFVNVAAKTSGVHPLAKTGFALLIAGVGLSWSLRGVRIERLDRRRLGVVAVCGGFLGPALLFWGLEKTTAVDASLLITLEMVFTAVLAVLLLHERHSALTYAGLAALFCGALVVAGAGYAGMGGGLAGNLLIALAALAYSFDNAASTGLAVRYPAMAIMSLKGMLGGSLALLVWLAAADLAWPTAYDWQVLLAVGFVGLGLANVLYYVSLRHLGAARATGLFLPGSALAGALAGRLAFKEPLGWPHALAAVLLLVGVALLLRGGDEGRLRA